MSAERSPSTRERVETAARVRPIALVALGAFLYSTSPVMVASSSISGTEFAFWRLVSGTVIFGVAAVVVRRRGGPIPLRAWRWALISGVAFGVHQLMFFSAVKATSVTDVSLITRLSPLFVGLLAVRVFGERPGRSFIAGAAIAMIGAAVVVLAGSSGPEGDAAGMAMAVGHVAAFSVWFVISKRSRSEIDLVRLFLGTFVVAGIMIAGFAAGSGIALPVPGMRDALLVFTVAAVPGAIGHIVSTWPLRWVPANIPPVVSLGIPISAGLQAWVFLGQGITAGAAFGGAVTLAGVAIAVLGRSGREMVAEAKRGAAAAAPAAGGH